MGCLLSLTEASKLFSFEAANCVIHWFFWRLFNAADSTVSCIQCRVKSWRLYMLNFVEGIRDERVIRCPASYSGFLCSSIGWLSLSSWRSPVSHCKCLDSTFRHVPKWRSLWTIDKTLYYSYEEFKNSLNYGNTCYCLVQYIFIFLCPIYCRILFFSMAVQPFEPWPTFQFLNPIHSQ
jgi:hypothetical protein